MINDSTDISSISEVSDLFGKEILPECTFESEYGKLKLNAVVVPDFSKNKIELEYLTKHFEAIKALMKEDDLVKKNEIIDSIFGFVPHVKFGMVTVGLDLTKSYLFINILRSSIKFRLFENGEQLQCDICSYFGYEMSPKFHSLITWNGTPIVQPLVCSTGIYIQSLGKCLNPNAVGVFRYPELVSELLENKKLPSHNYLSWALHGASSDESLLPFVKEHKIKALKCK